jgi:hypothetical protein
MQMANQRLEAQTYRKSIAARAADEEKGSSSDASLAKHSGK